MKQTVVIYARISTGKQNHDSQLAELREYCARRKWEEVEEIVDTASGVKSSREGLDRLMKAVRRGKVVMRRDGSRSQVEITIGAINEEWAEITDQAIRLGDEILISTQP